MRYRKTLNSQLEIAVEHDKLTKAFNHARGLIKVLFNYSEPDEAEVLRIILDDKACQEQIETCLDMNLELEWEELHGFERLGGRRPAPDDIVEAYRNAEEARKQLLAIEAEHGEQLQAHWDYVDRILDQERHRCSVLAVEIHQHDNLVLRATRPPGGAELEVEVLDGAFAERLISAPDLWIQSFSFSATGLASTECLFSPYRVKLQRKKFHESVSDHAIANVLAWLRHVRQVGQGL